MGAVEDPQLGLLEGGDVGDQLDPGPLPRWPAAGEGVLEHPLRERLGDDRPVVGHAGALGGQGTYVLGRSPGPSGRPSTTGRQRSRGSSRPGRRRGARRARRPPGASPGRWPGRLSQETTVNGASRRRGAWPAPRPGGRAGTGARPGGQVVGDLRARGVQGPGGPGRAVPGLGHGDGDDLDGGVGEAPERRLRVAGGDDGLADGTDQPRPVAAVAAFEQGVQVPLAGQRAVQRRRAQGDGADAAGQRARGQDLVAVHGLVGAVEHARPDVHDRGADAGGVVGRHGRPPRCRGGQPGPRRVVRPPLSAGRHRSVGRQEGPAGSADL